MATLRGYVGKVIHQGERFFVLSFDVDHTEPPVSEKRVTVSGHLYGLTQIRAGISVQLVGDWVRHPKYGRQFSPYGWFPWATSDLSVERFLTECVEGFSDESLVQKIVSAFGTLTFEKLTDSPNQVLDLIPDKESPQRLALENALFRWNEARALSNLSIFLQDYDLSEEVVRQVFAQFGMDAVTLISENPYRLVAVEGFSFAKADRLAKRTGIKRDDPRRLDGAVLWILRKEAQNGHLSVRRGDFSSLVVGLSDDTISGSIFGDVTAAQLMEAVTRLEQVGAVKIDPNVGVYLPSYYKFEREGAAKLAEFLTPAKIDINLEMFLADYEKGNQIDLSDAQREALDILVSKKVLVMAGKPGTGKCVREDTLVSSSEGIRKIGSYLPTTLLPDEDHGLEVTLDTSKGPHPSAYVYNGGEVPTIKLTTHCGYFLEGTPEHPIRVLRNGALTWSALGELKIGDTVPLVINPDLYSFGSSVRLPEIPEVEKNESQEFSVPEFLTEDLALILGYLTSEGSVVSRQTLRVSNYDHRILRELEALFTRVFRITPHLELDSRPSPALIGNQAGIQVHNTRLIRWLRSIGVGPDKAWEKTIPETVLRADRNTVRAYLRALFEGDGGASTENRRSGRTFEIEYGSTSARLISQLHTLLLTFGVVAKRRVKFPKPVVNECHPYHSLVITGDDYNAFYRNVGFHITPIRFNDSKSNSARHFIYGIEHLIKELMVEVNPKSMKEYLQFYRHTVKNKSYSRKITKTHLGTLIQKAPNSAVSEKLRELSQNYFYDKVEEISNGFSQVVDFGVPLVHEFLSNGFISHNTTLVKAAVKLLKQSGKTFALMAPTGIAAKRLSAVTGEAASTIHRFFGHDGHTWSYNGRNKFAVDAVIVDESSMVDMELFYRVLDALHPSTLLLLVGDDAQLPSVGPGNVLRELLSCPEIPHVRLSQIFRQSKQSEIVIASHKINKGESPQLENIPSDSEFQFVSVRDEDRIASLIVQMATKLKARDANFQVLSAKYEGSVGINILNELLREKLNPHVGQNQCQIGKFGFREGDRVMVIKNDYKLNVSNGDMGKLAAITRDTLKVRIHGIGHNAPDSYVDIPKSRCISMLRLAYAISIHKSQGAEFDTVILPMTRSQGRMLQRNLIYTAITRAKKKVWVIGESTAVFKAIGNDRVVQRNTALGAAVLEAAKKCKEVT